MDDDDEQSGETERSVETEHPPAEAVADFVDTGGGAGAYSTVEDWVRENSQDGANDGRSSTNTYFKASDAQSTYPAWQKGRKKRNKRSWRTLATWQDGAHSNIESRGGANWQADKERWIDTFGDKMGATEHHEERAEWILDRLEMRPYLRRNSAQMTVNAEIIIIVVLSLLIDQDIDDFENRALTRDGTRELLEDIESDVETYDTIRTVVRERDSDLVFRDH